MDRELGRKPDKEGQEQPKGGDSAGPNWIEFSEWMSEYKTFMRWVEMLRGEQNG